MTALKWQWNLAKNCLSALEGRLILKERNLIEGTLQRSLSINQGERVNGSNRLSGREKVVARVNNWLSPPGVPSLCAVTEKVLYRIVGVGGHVTACWLVGAGTTNGSVPDRWLHPLTRLSSQTKAVDWTRHCVIQLVNLERCTRSNSSSFRAHSK